MKRSEAADQARRVLDARFTSGTAEALQARPRGGWIRAIRSALGMSQAALGSRLSISQAAIAQLEKAEMGNAITLAKLAEVAGALDCRLVYAFVPRTSLEKIVREQASDLVARQAQYVGATMALEDQALTPGQQEQVLQRQIDAAIDSGDLWR